jgi:hypothetical protein
MRERIGQEIEIFTRETPPTPPSHSDSQLDRGDYESGAESVQRSPSQFSLADSMEETDAGGGKGKNITKKNKNIKNRNTKKIKRTKKTKKIRKNRKVRNIRRVRNIRKTKKV